MQRAHARQAGVEGDQQVEALGVPHPADDERSARMRSATITGTVPSGTCWRQSLSLNVVKWAFVRLTEQIDTSTPARRLIFHVFGALAEFERDLIRERTQAGLETARRAWPPGGHVAMDQ